MKNRTIIAAEERIIIIITAACHPSSSTNAKRCTNHTTTTLPPPHPTSLPRYRNHQMIIYQAPHHKHIWMKTIWYQIKTTVILLHHFNHVHLWPAGLLEQQLLERQQLSILSNNTSSTQTTTNLWRWTKTRNEQTTKASWRTQIRLFV